MKTLFDNIKSLQAWERIGIGYGRYRMVEN